MSDSTTFIAEGYARQVVPDAQLGGGHRVFFIVAGALCGLPGFVLSAQVVHGMGMARARYAFVAGGLISGTLGALSAYSGARTRMNLAMLADEAFGKLGGRVVKTMIALSCSWRTPSIRAVRRLRCRSCRHRPVWASAQRCRRWSENTSSAS